MGSFEMPAKMRSSALLEPSCGYLLQELKLIWDEIGQDQIEKEKVLLELEQECLDVYRRKVDGANIARARLHQSLADSEAEFTHLLVSLGERSFPSRPEKITGTLKEQLDSITPALREMQLRKEERVNQFRAVQMQIQKISAEIEGLSELNISPTDVPVNENDLSLKKLDEYRVELQRLHREKNDRLRKVEEYTSSVRNLATTMGMDASEIIATVHPSLDASCGQQSKNISDAILARLNSTVESLKEEKQKRLEKLHKLGKSLKNLWNLMDTSFEDRRSFSHITGFISTSAADVWKPGSLALDIIHQAEAEVERLDQLKASKMKELFLKKRLELEEICKRTHMEIPSQSEINNITNLINSGEIDHADLLASMDEQISKAKEEAYSRTDIMEKVEKWIVSSDEERWLEEYSRDENRYSVSRGAHKNLKRAERARITADCNLVLYDKSEKIWATNTEASFCSLTLQRTGELVLYNAAGKRMWGSNKKGGQGNYVLVLEKDRNLVVYGTGRWCSNTNVAATSPPRIPIDMDMRAEYVLYPGSFLYPGNSLKNGKWELKLEPSCNLVLYEDGDKDIWSTKTARKANTCYLRIEVSGHLNLYSGAGIIIWTSGTGAGHSVLVLQNDRNMCVYGPGIWNTGTQKSGLGFPFSHHDDTNITIPTLPLLSS